MLVTCFGYTGYKNAKFGRIDVHERITMTAREVLLETKAIAEKLGFTVLHGIVDCFWVQGEPIRGLKQAVEEETGYLTEVERLRLAGLPPAKGRFRSLQPILWET